MQKRRICKLASLRQKTRQNAGEFCFCCRQLASQGMIHLGPQATVRESSVQALLSDTQNPGDHASPRRECSKWHSHPSHPFSECAGARLEALVVHIGRAGLVVLLLGDPHLLEGAQAGQDGAADPDGVLSLRRRDDLHLDPGRRQCCAKHDGFRPAPM